MKLINLIFLLFIGIAVIIKPTVILTDKTGLGRSRRNNPLLSEPADQSYDKSTIRLWRGLGIAITIFAIWFLLKYFNVL